MKYRSIVIAILGAGIFNACGPVSEPANTVLDGPDSLTIVQHGGCAMMGPNCPTWILQPDGTFELTRTGQDDTEAEGMIDPEAARELWDEMGATDFDALIGTLGPGSCQACVDGIDTVLEIEWEDDTVVLDSTQVEFSSSEPLFVLVGEVIEEMTEVAPLPVMNCVQEC